MKYRDIKKKEFTGGQFENMIHYKQCRLIPYK
jgi:hypothetical protein